MRIEYDPNLVEQAVFLKARGNPRLERELHVAIDPLYASPPGYPRESQYQEVFKDYFRRLGLDGVVSALLAERRIIGERASRCLVSRAGGAKDSGAELYVRPGADDAETPERTVVMALTAEQLCDADTLRLHLRRELLHIADMLDDDFGYRKEEWENLPVRRNLIRDRYRVLWDGYVEGRLLSEGRSTIAELERLRSAFRQGFAADLQEADASAFDRVVYGHSLTHRDLWAWAQDPGTLMTAGGKGRERGRATAELCPLCRFPTCDWYRFQSDGDAGVVARVRRLFPDWNEGDGACRQCVESSEAWSAKDESHSKVADRISVVGCR